MTAVGGSGKHASKEHGPPNAGASSSDAVAEDFDESAYLAAFPDVASSIMGGDFPSALHHYQFHGWRESRLTDPRYEALVHADTAGFPAACVDVVYGRRDGQCLVWGWVSDDGQDPVSKLSLRNGLGLRGSTTAIYRYRRQDVSAHLNLPEDRALAFWAVVTVERPETMSAPVELTLSVGAERKTFGCQIHPVDDERFRELALDLLAKTRSVHAPVENLRFLDAGLGRSLIGLNLEVSRRMAVGAQTVQIGVAPARPEASVIVCLYGKPELLRIQCALFSKCRGIENYEFIYVSNSPEIAELLIKDATIVNRIYGMPITLILMPGNAGFGVANNVGAAAARSGRLLIVNPDIFPMDMEWPLEHSRMVKDLPSEQVALFGAPLYYDDGSLMHGGMYFEVDAEFSFRDQKATRCEMLRVEHYGKGAPPQTNPFLVSRPVPAVTGAFMSIERTWFESLGGFSPEYIYGQYEDADLCLKSFTAGKPAWLHCLPFVHFEGKGSTYHQAFDGGCLVNRWHFTNVWGDTVKESLNGPAAQALSTQTHAERSPKTRSPETASPGPRSQGSSSPRISSPRMSSPRTSPSGMSDGGK